MDALRTALHLLLIRPMLRLLFGVNVVGRENLNRIARTHPVAARDYFENPPWLFKTVQFLLQPVWVDREESGISAIKELQKRLDDGHSIIIFPEGTRGTAGELQEFCGGVGLIAGRNPDVPIIPVYLEGPERAFPKEASFPLPLWNHITIGPPLLLQGRSRDITSRLHDHLEVLAEEERAYRQRRMTEPHKPFVVAVIGIDGSGKSTLSHRLAGCFAGDSCFIGDSLELFKDGAATAAQPLVANEVRKWVDRQAKSARSLKHYKIPKLAELLLRDRLLADVHRWYRPNRVFMDGSPLLNMAGWAILYHEDAYQAIILVNGYLGSDLPYSDQPLSSGEFYCFGLRDLGTSKLPAQIKHARDGSIMDDPERWGLVSITAKDHLELIPDHSKPFSVNVDGGTFMAQESMLFERIGTIPLIANESFVAENGND